VDAFVAAVTDGDLDRLTGLLSADAILYSDGGGVVRAARVPIYTAPKIARFFLGIARKGPPGTVVDVALVNGGVGLRMMAPDGPVGVLAFDVAEGVITGVYVVVTPLKLERLGGARL
jgi:RNA polymerase sigma-70 factor (ECF subfamily)